MICANTNKAEEEDEQRKHAETRQAEMAYAPRTNEEHREETKRDAPTVYNEAWKERKEQGVSGGEGGRIWRQGGQTRRRQRREE
jgi:hypothetical protein